MLKTIGVGNLAIGGGLAVGIGFMGESGNAKYNRQHGSSVMASRRNLAMDAAGENLGIGSAGTGTAVGAAAGGGIGYGVSRLIGGRATAPLAVLGAALGAYTGRNAAYGAGTRERGQLFHSYTGDQGANTGAAVEGRGNTMAKGVAIAGGVGGYAGVRRFASESAGRVRSLATGKGAAGAIGLGIGYLLSRSQQTADPNASRIRGLGY